jgi:hypothetical protein
VPIVDFCHLYIGAFIPYGDSEKEVDVSFKLLSGSSRSLTF